MIDPDTFHTSRHTGLTVGVATPAAGLSIVTLGGRLDAVAAPDLRARLDVSDVAGCPQIVFDLAAVDFVDSAGLAVLVWQRRTCRAHGGDVVLVRPDSDNAMRVFRLTQFDQIFRMLPQQQND